MIITEGKSNNTFYVIKSGEATVTKAGAVLTTLKSGGFFGHTPKQLNCAFCVRSKVQVRQQIGHEVGGTVRRPLVS